MRSRWPTIRAEFVASISNLQAARQFRKINLPRRFDDPVAIVTYLSDGGRDLDEKDTICAALVECNQVGGASSKLALSLLVLGLWPGLDRILRRRQRQFAHDPDELVSLILSRFTGAVLRADLRRVNRVAATLVLNTDRLVGDVFEGEQRELGRRASDEEQKHAELRRGNPPPELSRLGLPVGLSIDDQIEWLHQWLRAAGVKDADIVVAHGIEQETQREIADRTGLKPEATRKRWQRGRDESAKAVSHFEEIDRVYPLKAKSGGGRDEAANQGVAGEPPVRRVRASAGPVPALGTRAGRRDRN